MTRSLIIEVTAVETTLPPDKVFLHYVYTLVDKAMRGDIVLRQVSQDLSARFDGLADATYDASVAAVATDESTLAVAAADVVVGGEVGVPQTYMAPTGLGFLVL